MSEHEIARTVSGNSLRHDSVVTLFHNLHAGLREGLDQRRFENGHLLDGDPMNSAHRLVNEFRQFDTTLVILFRTAHECANGRLLGGNTTVEIAEALLGWFPIEHGWVTRVGDEVRKVITMRDLAIERCGGSQQ